MADRWDVSRQEHAPDAQQDNPNRPGAVVHSVVWPEIQTLEVQQRAANRMFHTNSENLQRQQNRRPDSDISELPAPDISEEKSLPEAKALEPGDYAGLRLETAKLANRDQESAPPEIPEGELTFARDRRGREIGQAPEERELEAGELSFSRAKSGHDLSRG